MFTVKTLGHRLDFVSANDDVQQNFETVFAN